MRERRACVKDLEELPAAAHSHNRLPHTSHSRHTHHTHMSGTRVRRRWTRNRKRLVVCRGTTTTSQKSVCVCVHTTSNHIVDVILNVQRDAKVLHAHTRLHAYQHTCTETHYYYYYDTTYSLCIQQLTTSSRRPFQTLPSAPSVCCAGRLILSGKVY